MANCSVQIHAETTAFELPAIVMRSGLCSQGSRIAKEFLRTFAHWFRQSRPYIPCSKPHASALTSWYSDPSSFSSVLTFPGRPTHHFSINFRLLLLCFGQKFPVLRLKRYYLALLSSLFWRNLNSSSFFVLKLFFYFDTGSLITRVLIYASFLVSPRRFVMPVSLSRYLTFYIYIELWMYWFIFSPWLLVPIRWKFDCIFVFL